MLRNVRTMEMYTFVGSLYPNTRTSRHLSIFQCRKFYNFCFIHITFERVLKFWFRFLFVSCFDRLEVLQVKTKPFLSCPAQRYRALSRHIYYYILYLFIVYSIASVLIVE